MGYIEARAIKELIRRSRLNNKLFAEFSQNFPKRYLNKKSLFDGKSEHIQDVFKGREKLISTLDFPINFNIGEQMHFERRRSGTKPCKNYIEYRISTILIK